MLNRISALFGQNSQTRNYAVLSSIDLETPKNERLRAFDTVMATNERAIIHKSDEDLEVEWYLHRGRKLADQAHWAQLFEEIRHFDGIRARTTGGLPISELLTRGARSRILAPVKSAFKDQDVKPSISGFLMMQAGAFDLDDDYAFSVLLAHAHMDASHLWYALADKDQTTAAYRAYSKHIDAAHSLLATACTQNEKSPYLLAAQCRLLDHDFPHGQSSKQLYTQLIELDPTTSQHLRDYGASLINPQSQKQDLLEFEAVGVINKTRDVWGIGSYAWMYLDALTKTASVYEKLDVAKFMEATIDIFERQTDQNTVNMFAALTAVSLSTPLGPRETSSAKRKRLQLHDTADWIVETHLREIHPRLWIEAAHWLKEDLAQAHEETKLRRGEEIALRVIDLQKSNKKKAV